MIYIYDHIYKYLIIEIKSLLNSRILKIDLSIENPRLIHRTPLYEIFENCTFFGVFCQTNKQIKIKLSFVKFCDKNYFIYHGFPNKDEKRFAMLFFLIYI